MEAHGARRGRGRGRGRARGRGRSQASSSSSANPSKRPRDEMDLDPATSRDRSSPSPASTSRPRSLQLPAAPPATTAESSTTLASAPPALAPAAAPAGKVAIPALRSQHATPSSTREKKLRATHACDGCRTAKVGCSGGQPCHRCQVTASACVYGDRKRDKDKKIVLQLSKENSSLAQQNLNVTEALRKLRLNDSMSSSVREALDDVIAMSSAGLSVSDEESGPVATPNLRPPSDVDDDTAEAGSTKSLDVVNLDTDRDDIRAMGHMGKSSAVRWTQRTLAHVQENERLNARVGASDLGSASTTYHTEEMDLTYHEPTDVDEFAWPDPILADRLVETFFQHTPPSFPILDRVNFMNHYNSFIRGKRTLLEDESLWLATLNVVFAISAIHGQVAKTLPVESHFDHLIFCARAKKLSMDQRLLYQDASISSLQALGLLALYYVAAGSLNKAWTLCGVSIRQALTLGLHVRSEAKDLSDVAKEHRVRLWWSLYTLECSLDELTGRPTCISDADISTPFPINTDIDDLAPGQSLYAYPDLSSPGFVSPSTSRDRPPATYQMPAGISRPTIYPFPILELPTTSSTFFIYRTQLSIISHEIVSQLYCAATSKEKWSEVQDVIRTINTTLLHFRGSLPAESAIDFEEWNLPDWDHHNTSYRVALALHFNSSRMILFRPYICRSETHVDRESNQSSVYEQKCAEHCIDAARNTIMLLGVATPMIKPNIGRLFSISPWWHILHYLCEALSILVLELAYKCKHMPKAVGNILDDAKKAVHLLRILSERSISARKAWEIYDILIKRVGVVIGWSTFDMPDTTFIPPGYSWQRFSQNTPATNLTEDTLAQTQYAPPDRFAATSSWADIVTFPSYATSPRGFAENMARNEVQPNVAFERFEQIWGLRGHFDDPWQHMFKIPDPNLEAQDAAGSAPLYEGDGGYWQRQ